MLHRLTGLLLWFQALSIVRASMGDSGCNMFLCLNITVNNDMMTYEVTPIWEPFGWVGLGFGRLMRDTHMIAIWEGDDGPILSQRYGGPGHIEPIVTPSPPRVATMVTPKIKSVHNWSSGNHSTVAFEIPLNKTDPRPGQIIWAYSLGRPESHPLAELKGHYVAGTINMKLDKFIPDFPGQLPPAPVSPRHQKLIWHGILVSVGFLFLLPTGSLIARWGRTFTPRWFKAHRIVNFGVALPVIAGGWVLGPLAVLDRQATHFADAHQICGVILFVLYLGQLFLGRYIHAKHTVEKPHPPSNILHAVLGISIIALAFLQINSGFKEWTTHTGQQGVSSWLQNALIGWAVLLPILYFSGLALLRRQFAQEQQGQTYSDSPAAKNYIALAHTPSTLMFDSEHDVPEYTEIESGAYSEIESGVPLLQRAASSA
ncbi:hypothetical protein C8R44DRAFT_884252 [Mycena epipterygia]|nr:hypothetical protein C8R44DRAFT_884252 [Mycena epipterygia]